MKIVLLFALLVLSGCSVKMAATKRGVGPEEILSCRSELCILALKDTEQLSEKPFEGGRIVTYRSLQKQGSTGRAVMHGLLDVATLGIWEVAGTPIEGSKSGEKYFVYKIIYDSEDKITKSSIEAAH